MSNGLPCAGAPADVPQSSATLHVVTRVDDFAPPPPSPRAGPDTTDAGDVVDPGSCHMEAGVSYPNGRVIYSGRRTKQGCCRWCVKKVECYSWYFDLRSKMCYLNGDEPSKILDGGFVGGTTL